MIERFGIRDERLERNGMNNQSQINSNMVSSSDDKKKKVIKILLIIGILLIIALIVYLGLNLMDGNDNTINTNNVVDNSNNVIKKIDNFEITKFILSDNIDNNFNYEPNNNLEYFSGENVYIYIEISGFEKENLDNKYQYDILENIYVYDYNGNLISDMSKENIEKQGNISKESSTIKFSNKIPIANSFKSGDYEVKLQFKDLISNKIVSDKKSFTVKNLTEILGGRATSIEQDLTQIGLKSGSVFVQKISVYDPDGLIIDELSSTQEYTVPQGTTPIYNNKIVIPSSYEPGEYKISIVSTNKETEEKISEEKIIVVEDKFKILNYRFLDSLGNKKNNNVYSVEDTVQIEIDLAGMKYLEKNGKYQINIIEKSVAYDESDNKIQPWSKNPFFEVSKNYDSRLEKYVLENKFVVPEYFPNGEYEIQLEFVDQVSGDIINKNIYFVIDGSWNLE